MQSLVSATDVPCNYNHIAYNCFKHGFVWLPASVKKKLYIVNYGNRNKRNDSKAKKKMKGKNPVTTITTFWKNMNMEKKTM